MNPLEVWDSVWVMHDDGDTLHITPPDDAVGHELAEDCVCGPLLEDLGGGDKLVAHEALDGRP